MIKSTAAAGEQKPESYYAKVRPEILALVPSDARTVLDVGCAEGVFGAALKQQRPDVVVWGIEPVAEAAVAARKKLEHVIATPVEVALDALPDGRFDCVTFNDCLEHLVDPWSVLRVIRRKLSKDGRVIASIPNLRHFPVMQSLLMKAEFSYADEGVLDRTHLRFFTESGMKALFAQSGYRVEMTRGLRAQKLPFWLSQLSKLMGWRFHDMQFLQYALVAVPEPGGESVEPVPVRPAEPEILAARRAIHPETVS